MEALLGFPLDFWDYATFLSLFVLTAGGLGLAVFIMGWVGFLAVVTWVQALAWAFRPTAVIDVRYMPEERRLETEQTIAKLTGKALPAITPPEAPAGDTPS
jgi:hypothetical protein